MNNPYRFLLIPFVLLAVVAGCDSESLTQTLSCDEWGYGADNGPAEWASMCSETCAASSQSPVNLIESQATQALPQPITFEYSETEMTLFNNGHTIEAGNEHATKANAITVAGKRYELLQFHFHSLSEHTINGEHSPIEMHLVHKLSDSELAVVGVMIEVGDSNPAFAPMWTQLPESESAEHVEVDVDVEALLPVDRAYFQYDGSLTTPNGSDPSASCAEIVNWLVMEDAVTMSAAQIDAFRDIFDHNYRPVQPLNGRTVSRVAD